MNNGNNLWYFENVDLFGVMCPHKFGEATGKTHKMLEFDKDEFIYFPNDASNQLYLVAEGRVRIGNYSDEGKENLKVILGKGELFGELALTGEGKRNDFAQAMDKGTKVCPMTTEHMEELMLDDQTFTLKILKLIGFRLKKMERRINSLVFKDARTRIVEFLKELGEEKGTKVGYEVMVKNHLTHKDIAALTGTSRQTVTTVLNELKEQNLISFDRRRILFRDLEALA
ncbi:Crp/Fnr family transcriptional regulator [Marinigracilibium pacificum]|uniref:Crp/Fnr family transcriptional regulator n=1 Tax=Marinigracilibium pacificum TaxID=2729599 RepID=A0A848J4X8_9BACT|nr:Crp/Fnr family transcriptional regulator [Marinigracilibium pacificum]NMM49514.1 Crp/Fnr family transcriptional regulator [Marinigracilibium pacificum]